MWIWLLKLGKKMQKIYFFGMNDKQFHWSVVKIDQSGGAYCSASGEWKFSFLCSCSATNKTQCRTASYTAIRVSPFLHIALTIHKKPNMGMNLLWFFCYPSMLLTQIATASYYPLFFSCGSTK